MTETFEKFCFNRNEVKENVKKKKKKILSAAVRFKLLRGKFNLELILFVTRQQTKSLHLERALLF